MARFDKAQWHGPVPNMSTGAMGPVRGVVLHIMQSQDNKVADTIEGCDSWFHNPQAQVSSHFGTGTEGELYQWVDTADMAWAQVNGNPNWISIENAGVSGDALLPSQVESVAEVLAWAAKEHGFPLQRSDSPDTPGLGWHGMGGESWGGHLACPGQPILDQRGAILERAAQIQFQGSPPPPPPPPPPPVVHEVTPVPVPTGELVRYTVRINTDNRGDGWALFGIPYDRIVGTALEGGDPAKGGYRQGSEQLYQQGPNTIVSVTGARPSTAEFVIVTATK